MLYVSSVRDKNSFLNEYKGHRESLPQADYKLSVHLGESASMQIVKRVPLRDVRSSNITHTTTKKFALRRVAYAFIVGK